MSTEHFDQSNDHDLLRKANALCGLIHFAQERCYPPALRASLETTLSACLSELEQPERVPRVPVSAC